MHDSLICPITFDLFRDPVVAEDGHTYEREAIIQWIREHGTSPLTREPLTVDALRPNRTLKKLVDEFETASRSKNFQFKLGVDVKTKSHRALFQTFGKTIYEAEWIKDNNSRPRIVLLKIDGARAKKEASFYVDLTRHPNIVRTFGLVHSDNNDDDDEDTQNSVTLLQELAPEGSLYEVLQHISLNENILQAMFLQITDAMIFLAHNGIIHGDLACRNVLVFRLEKQEPHKNIVKLTDFGISRHSKLYTPTNSVARTTINIVPTRYAAPEVLANEQYSEKSDVYSMGVLMWEAYSKGKIPWSQSNSDDEVKRHVTQGEKLQKPKNCSTQMWSVIESCFILSVEGRPTFTDLKHSLLPVPYQLTTPPKMENQPLKNEDAVVKKQQQSSEVQIPCEFCQKLCDLQQLEAHQETCQTVRTISMQLQNNSESMQAHSYTDYTTTEARRATNNPPQSQMSNSSSSRKHFVCQYSACDNRCDCNHSSIKFCTTFYDALCVDGGHIGNYLLYVRKCEKCNRGGVGVHDYFATDRCKCKKCGHVYCEACCFK